MKIFKVLISLLFIACTATVFGAVSGIEPGYIMACLTAVSVIPMPAGVLGMAITKELWINDVVANLFKANPHLANAYNADAFVYQGKVVHIPNAGSKPAITKNRSSYPATVVNRTDTDITFSLDEYSSEPEGLQMLKNTN